LDERFFSEGIQSDGEVFAPKQSSVRPHEPEEEIDPKLLLKMHPDVRARRAKFAPIVKWVVLGAVLLGLGGLVKHKIAQGDQETAAREMAEYAATHAPASTTKEDKATTAPPPAVVMPGAENAASGEAPVPAAMPKPTEGLAAPADSAEVHEAPVAAAGSGAVAAVASVSPPPEGESAPAKTAAQEKRDCQVFLDRGAFAKAVEAGQRSVAVDPSDGEAWLLLGAAYQSLGRVGDAKRSFSACLRQGKKGPLAECKAMLQ
jgi:tetratricopeptide (TPR) repeat protein